jgi:short-subunit dehydrogenase involved in D-alanine esterification of teichoic acids
MEPIRMSAALIEHLKQQDDAIAADTSSILGFASLVFSAAIPR